MCDVDIAVNDMHDDLRALVTIVVILSGEQVPIGVRAHRVMITKLKLDKNRKALLERKGRASTKGKYSEKDVAAGGSSSVD